MDTRTTQQEEGLTNAAYTELVERRWLIPYLRRTGQHKRADIFQRYLDHKDINLAKELIKLDKELKEEKKQSQQKERCISYDLSGES